MKIALVHKRLELRGGTERVLYRTAEGLRDRGHDVHLFCQKFRIPAPEGVQAHPVTAVSWPRALRALTFAVMAPRTVTKNPCDTVISFDRILTQDIIRSGGGSRKMLLRKMKQQSPFLKRLWYSIVPYHRITLWLERLQISGNRTGKIIAVSESTKREFMELYEIREEDIVVIHNGVDLVRFHPRRRLIEGKRMREQLRIPSNAQVALFVGTGFRRKGLHRLMALWERHELPGVYLVVVGNDAKFSYYRRRWAGDDVIFTGAQRNVEDYYACADVFVLPAIQEAFGNAVLEAMASGLPVITVAGVGAMDRIEGPLSEGILSDPNDPAELKIKILRMLDRTRWPTLARLARESAEKYTWDDYLDKIEQTLFQCRSRLEKDPECR
jgi:UDP-glucose:(heptosyl)LPS alpha-1,3-glucosyltransferase